jgi:hypothetical protein
MRSPVRYVAPWIAPPVRRASIRAGRSPSTGCNKRFRHATKVVDRRKTGAATAAAIGLAEIVVAPIVVAETVEAETVLEAIVAVAIVEVAIVAVVIVAAIDRRIEIGAIATVVPRRPGRRRRPLRCLDLQ